MYTTENVAAYKHVHASAHAHTHIYTPVIISKGFLGGVSFWFFCCFCFLKKKVSLQDPEIHYVDHAGLALSLPDSAS